MLSQHLPRLKEEISLSIERYATVAIEKIHSDALARNLRWEEQQSSLQDAEPKEEESSQPVIETTERREGRIQSRRTLYTRNLFLEAIGR